MTTSEIPNECPECGTPVRLRNAIEPSLGSTVEYRCDRGCTVRDAH